MATYISAFDPEYVLAGEWQIEAGDTFTGIYFDGMYFFVLDTNALGIRQYYFNGTSIDLVRTISLNLTLAADESLSSVFAITGDGKNLYVLLEILIVSGMAATTNHRIYCVDYEGNELDHFGSWSGLTTAVYDIGFDGKHFCVTSRVTSISSTNTWRYYDKGRLNITRSINPSTNFRQLSFDGYTFKVGTLTSGTTRGKSLDFDLVQNQANVDMALSIKSFHYDNCDNAWADFFDLGGVMPGSRLWTLRSA